MQKHRDTLRTVGLRPIQIWVPDTSQLGFVEECRRQSSLVAQADLQDTALETFLDDAVRRTDDWQI